VGKFAVTWKVTAPLFPILTLLRLKVADEPLKLTVVTSVPFIHRLMEVTPVGGTPVSEIVMLFRATTLLLGLFICICWIVTPEAP
jgi:hypothetical protein